MFNEEEKTRHMLTCFHSHGTEHDEMNKHAEDGNYVVTK